MIGSFPILSGRVGTSGLAAVRMTLAAAFDRLLVWITVGRTRRMLATLVLWKIFQLFFISKGDQIFFFLFIFNFDF